MRLDALLGFERQGHCTVHKALAPQQLQAVIPAIDRVWTSQALAVHCQKVSVLLPSKEAAVVEAKAKQAPSATKRLEIYQRALEALPEGSAPFLQCFNLWRQSREVAALACSPELAGSAARLLGAERVRLYQDSLFVKRPGDGPTHWHSDLAMAPLDTNSFVTVWLPLQPVPPETEGGSALVFASGSHRDVALSFWHGSDADCSNRGYAEALAERSLRLGDCTWHHGWTLHCSSPNALQRPRRALTFSYFADGATRLDSRRRTPHTEDADSYAAWLSAVKPGHVARHHLLPLVWDDGEAQQIRLAEWESNTDRGKTVPPPGGRGTGRGRGGTGSRGSKR
jgi:hypothetical protein